MLKKIPVSHLRVGMHLHAFEGAWTEHPFWRTRFVIDSGAALDEVRGSGVAECWIDLDRGLDVEVAGMAPREPLPKQPAPLPSSVDARPLVSELKEAAAICQRARGAVVSMFAEARLGRVVDAEQCLPLVEDITRSVQRNASALVSLARLKTRDDYSYMHSVAVCALMVALARQLGQDEQGCREAGLAGLFHDVGKALVPSALLLKPGRLTADEMRVMRSHAERGHDLLAASPGASARTLDVVLHHHERIDGRGYPHGLQGDSLTLLARMGAVCDVYDAITSDRPYKNGWDPAESISRMASWEGQFDSKVLTAFVHCLGIYPVGSVVRLASGRLAVVVEQSPGALLAPVVRVFFSTKSQHHISPERVDLSKPGCQDRIVAREPVAAGQFASVNELWADPALLRKAQNKTS